MGMACWCDGSHAFRNLIVQSNADYGVIGRSQLYSVLRRLGLGFIHIGSACMISSNIMKMGVNTDRKQSRFVLQGALVY